MHIPPASSTANWVSRRLPEMPPELELLRLRPVMYTVAPASPSPIAIPLPMPRVAPVTNVTLPSRCFMSAFLIFLVFCRQTVPSNVEQYDLQFFHCIVLVDV